MGEYTLIKHEEYAEAVIHLYELALHDSSGSLCAAEVLLSLYNGNNFHADLASIACNLDADHFTSAIIAIKGRKQLHMEPHQVIEDGDEHFRKLAERWWDSVSVHERYKRYYRSAS